MKKYIESIFLGIVLMILEIVSVILGAWPYLVIGYVIYLVKTYL